MCERGGVVGCVGPDGHRPPASKWPHWPVGRGGRCPRVVAEGVRAARVLSLEEALDFAGKLIGARWLVVSEAFSRDVV